MNPIKKLLAVGGVTALVISGAVIGGDKEIVYTDARYTHADIVIEEVNAKIGDEIVSLRTSNAKIIKLDNGKRSIKLYQTKQHYLDSETGEYREYDTSVKQISGLAKMNPLRTHDEYVDPGEDAPKTTWFENIPYDYTFKDVSGDNYISFEALYDTSLVTHKMEYNKFGTDLFVVINDKADANSLDNKLSWKLDSNTDIQLNQDGSLIIADSDILVKPPWIRDSDLTYYHNNIAVSLNGDTLIYTLNIPDNISYPITIDPSTTVTANSDRTLSAISRLYLGSGVGSRDTLRAGATSTGENIVGQRFNGTLYRNDRPHMAFELSTANILSVSAGTLYVYLKTDESTTDFFVQAVSSFRRETWQQSWEYFDGYQTGAIYTGEKLTDSLSSNGISTGQFYPMAFTANGVDTLTAHAADSLRIMLISDQDYIRSTPTDNEYMEFESSLDGGKEPFLGLTYTTAVPTDFSMTALNADTLRCTWTDTYTGEDGFRIIKSPYGGVSDYVDSVMTPNAETIDVTGHTPNTLYQYKVQVIDAAAEPVSTADSTYTHANIPHTLITTSPNADSAQLIFNVASNPAYTNFAIRRIVSNNVDVFDTSYVNFNDSDMMILRNVPPGTYMNTPNADSSYIWGTYADIQAVNNNDTLTVAGNTGIEYKWEVWALSGSVNKR